MSLNFSKILMKRLLSEGKEVSLCVFVHSSCPAGTCDGCTFHFLWESASACPRCTEDDYHQIDGACKQGVQVTQTHTHTIFTVAVTCNKYKKVIGLLGDYMWMFSVCRKLSTCGTSQNCAPKVFPCGPGASLPARPSPCG